MGDIEDMDIEKGQKYNKKELLDNKVGLPYSKVIEEMNKLGLNRRPPKRKSDRIMDRLIKSLDNHDYIENKNQQN